MNLNKHNFIRDLDGPKDSVLLACYGVGIGASIHAMPAVSALVEKGIRVTVNCREFVRPLWESLGVTVISIKEPFGPAWAEVNRYNYGRVYSLHAYDTWEPNEHGFHAVGTMHEMAELLGVELPDTFSWTNLLKPEYSVQEPYVLFCPTTTEPWRTIPPRRAEAIKQELEKEHKVIELKGTECATFQELINLIYNAESVVAVESGVANIAGALNKPLVVITGPTEANSHVGQYTKYIPDLQYEEWRGQEMNGCSMPCYRNASRGFTNGKCLGKHEIPQCLSVLHAPDVTKFLHSLEYDHVTTE